MMYTEIAPAPELAGLVECFWTTRSDVPLPGERLTRVVPDNCSDIIFDFGHRAPQAEVLERRPRSCAVGAMRRPLVVHLTGTIDLLGVRFRPGCGPAFLGVPANELTARIVPLEDLWGQPGRDAGSMIAEAGGAGRVRAFEALLRRRRGMALEHHPAVTHTLRWIEDSGGRMCVSELHGAIGLSRRQLERLYAAAVGISPKLVCRVARFRAAQRRLVDQPGLALAHIAFACGYADQPHFTREFTELAGIPPRAYRRERAVASIQDNHHARR